MPVHREGEGRGGEKWCVREMLSRNIVITGHAHAESLEKEVKARSER
jgi:hypothetical protein